MGRRSFQESEHPRDPHTGEFVDKDGWAGQIVDRLVGGAAASPTRRGPGVGRDIRDELDVHAISRLPGATGPGAAGGDKRLAAILEHQGFDGRPEVVSRDEMDHRVASGWREVWRGLGSYPDGGKMVPAEEAADQFRYGSLYPGWGVRGNGTYTSTGRYGAVQYTESSRPADDLFPDGTPRGLLRIAIHPDAKTIDHAEIQMQVLDRRGKLKQAHGQVGSLPMDKLVGDPGDMLFVDEGRLAAAMGYDAITVRYGSEIQMVIVLNRTAVAVEEAPGG